VLVLRDSGLPWRLRLTPPAEVLDEAAWLGAHGVRELFLVSENTTSYGKDLADLRLLERLLPQLAAVEGISRVRCSYLQPAETRPGLLDALAGTPGVVPYFDLSFQHAVRRYCAECAVSATPSASWACWTRFAVAPAGRGAQQCHRGLSRRDRARCRRAR
jgi:hypothetical protein